MRPSTAALPAVLTSDFKFELIADVFYGATRTVFGLPITDASLQWDAESDLKSGASLTVDYASNGGESLVPADFASALAPFGQQVNILAKVSAGGFSETVQVGRYRITLDPAAKDQTFDHQGRTVVSSSHVELELDDLMLKLQRWGFRYPGNPASTSAWDELARISGMPVIRNLPDAVLSPTLVYDATEGGRLKAVQAIAAALGGVPYTDPYGALTVLPDANGDVAIELVLGEYGTVLDVTTSMDSTDVYNCVVGQFEDDDRNPITSVASISDGGLSVDGEYGEYTKYVSNDNVKTQAAADAFVAAELARVSATQTYRVPIRCIVDPRIELGDMVKFPATSGETSTGRVVTYAYGLDGYMDLEADVIRTIGG